MNDLFPKMNPKLKWGLIIAGIVLAALIFWQMFG